jgi:hypothetical protein
MLPNMLPLRLALVTVTYSALLNASASWGKESLKGLTIFSVSVVLEPRCGQIIAVDRIQTDVELKLRSAGLTLKQNAQREEGGAAVDVSVGCLPIIQGCKSVAWAADYTVAVAQGVDLKVSHTPALAMTWSVDGMIVGSGGGATIENMVRANIRDSVDEFLNDFFTVNPKK